MHRRQFLKAAASTAAGGNLVAAATAATAAATPKINAGPIGNVRRVSRGCRSVGRTDESLGPRRTHASHPPPPRRGRRLSVRIS